MVIRRPGLKDTDVSCCMTAIGNPTRLQYCLYGRRLWSRGSGVALMALSNASKVMSHKNTADDHRPWLGAYPKGHRLLQTM